MQLIISVLTLSCLFIGCFAGLYGRKSKRCNEFDPPSLSNIKLNEFAGKWSVIRIKRDSKACERIGKINIVVEWIKDQDKAIVSERLAQDNNICAYHVQDFKPVPGTRRSEFEFLTSQAFRTIQWRIVFKSSKYLLTWGCFVRKGRYCIDWASFLLSRSRTRAIPKNDLRWLDKASKRATCKTVSGDYSTTTTTTKEDCPPLGLPADQVCPWFY